MQQRYKKGDYRCVISKMECLTDSNCTGLLSTRMDMCFIRQKLLNKIDLSNISSKFLHKVKKKQFIITICSM
ncbi:unnamed protein product [Parnassius mnemosyne]|uniref:Uncharacterized protein n=1 Tax=Parnassius mnemosyne TaxID=213953 RepID=A0AAV1KQL6_9NEOP